MLFKSPSLGKEKPRMELVKMLKMLALTTACVLNGLQYSVIYFLVSFQASPLLSPLAAETEYLCTWEAWCSTDLSGKIRALLIGVTLLIPLKGYRPCWRGLKSSTGMYFSSKLCMQKSHKKGGSMNLSCPELALPLLGDLLCHRHVAHDLSHPCPPPFSSWGKEP